LIGPSATLLEHWAHLRPPRKAPLSTHNRHIYRKGNLFSLYTWELNFGQTLWDKTEVLLAMCRGTSWELEAWEHDVNKWEKKQPCSGHAQLWFITSID
jgi:hypothetical protein